MLNAAPLIQKVIAEHKLLREQMQHVNEAVNDVEAVFSLDRVSSAWVQSSLETLGQRQQQPADHLGELTSGLDRHFAFEEESLPLVLGSMLMEGFVSEHNEIRLSMAACREKTDSVHFDGLRRAEALSTKEEVLQFMMAVRTLTYSHLDREEAILRMLESGLQSIAVRPR
jgi:hypothetical protein